MLPPELKLVRADKRKISMKTTKAIGFASAALAVLASLGAYAQGGNAASSPPDTASAPDAKAIKAADRALQKSVLRALSKTKGLRVATITVRARSGVVTLEGTVPEQAQIGMATQAAEGVEGVTSVKNALTLSTF
jgi:hyperosmotically inducible periplasmic protein